MITNTRPPAPAPPMMRIEGPAVALEAIWVVATGVAAAVDEPAMKATISHPQYYENTQPLSSIISYCIFN